MKKHMSVKEKLNFIQQAEEANLISIKRFCETDDVNSIRAIIRREANVNKMLKEITSDIIDQNGDF